MRTLVLAVASAWVALLFTFLVSRAHDYEQADLERLEARVTQIEIHDCGLRQYEDYSVGPQTSDEARLRCVGVVMGEIVCDERIVDTELYLGNCRRLRTKP